MAEGPRCSLRSRKVCVDSLRDCYIKVYKKVIVQWSTVHSSILRYILLFCWNRSFSEH